MYDYSRENKGSVYSGRTGSTSTEKPYYDLMRKQLLRQMQGGLMTLFEEDQTQSFSVPKGWSLKKLATHLNTTVEELKSLNSDKLQN